MASTLRNATLLDGEGHGGRSSEEPLINELVHVTVQPALRWERCVIQVATFIVALAGLHEHDSPLEALAVRTGEEHGGRSCATGRAASPIQTHPAVVGSIETRAAAASVAQTQRFGRLLRTRALPPLLLDKHKAVTVTSALENKNVVMTSVG